MNKDIEKQEEPEQLSLETYLISAIMQGDIKNIKYFLELGAATECTDEEGRTPLYWASYYGQSKAVSILLEHGANINAKSTSGASPLFIAALMGHTETVITLCNKGADVGIQEVQSDMSSLFAAALNGHTEVVHALCDNGADIERKDSMGCTPFFIAAAQGHKDAMLALAGKGANIHAVDDNGWNIPCVVAQNGYAELLAILAELGCDVDAPNRFGMTPLFIAAQEGHADIVRYLLERGANINAKSNNGDTPLMVAVGNNRREIARMLIRQGADVNDTNSSGWSACMHAIANNDEEIAQELKDKGANSNIAEGEFIKIENNPETMRRFLECVADESIPYVIKSGGSTPLMGAAASGYADIVNKMLNKECKIDATDSDGNTALYYAVANRQTEVVRMILENGANTEIKNQYGWNPLICAAFNGYNEIVGMLINHGADLNAKEHKTNATPLHLAAQTGHFETIKILIENGADTEARQNGGATPLLIAVDKNQIDSVKVLLQLGANLEAADLKGRTPLLIAVSHGYTDLAIELIKKGAEIDRVRDGNATALHIAAENGHTELVLSLLEQGANIEAKNNQQWTPLHVAAQCGNADIIKILVNKGARLNDKEEWGATPLIIAASYGYTEIVSLLLNSGADISATDDEGRSSLHIASQNGHAEVIKTLLANGADINEKGTMGETPLILAVCNKHKEAVKTLLDMGADVNTMHPFPSSYDWVRKDLKINVLSFVAALGMEEILAILLEVPNIDLGRGVVHKHMCKQPCFMLGGLVYNPAIDEIIEVEEHVASPLSLACIQGHSEIARTLLAHKEIGLALKTNKRLFDLWGNSAPEWESIVCAASNKSVLNILLDFVADDMVMRQRAYKALLDGRDICTLERITQLLGCPTGEFYGRWERQKFQIELMLERLDECRPILQDSLLNLLQSVVRQGDSATLAQLIEKMEVESVLAQLALEVAFEAPDAECIKLLMAVPGVDVMPSLIVAAARTKETLPLSLCLMHPSARKPLPVSAIMAAVEKNLAKNLQLLLAHPWKLEGSCKDALILAAKRKGKMFETLLRAFDWSEPEVIAAFEASIASGSQESEVLDLLLSEYELPSATIVSSLLAAVKKHNQRNMDKLLTMCVQKNIELPQRVLDEMWISSLKKKQHNLLHSLLTDFGLNVNKVIDFPQGRHSALSYAVSEGNTELVKILLAVKGIDVNNRDNLHGMTPLTLAVSCGFRDVAQLLLDASGVDLNAIDAEGRTALDLARMYKDEQLIDMLQKAKQ